MKKLSLLLFISLTTALLLTACGKNSEKPSDDIINGADIGLGNKTEEKTEPASSEISTEEESPDGKIRSPLTNEWIDAALENQRPIAVMVPNDTSALPHYSISNADILYEIMVEGNITRLMMVIQDWQNLERIGNVRSARHYFVFAAYEWDSIFCHYGNPYHADFVLDRPETQRINGMAAPSGVFFRTSDRKAPQNAYLSGEGILKAVDSYQYPLTHTDNYEPNHYNFTPENAPNNLSDIAGSFNATKVDLSGAYPIDKPYFEYNEKDGLYYRYQYGKAHLDGANNEPLAFKNILVQNTYYEVLDPKGYLSFQMHDTTKKGYFFTNGKGIPVTWKKTSDFGATRYYDTDGNEIILNTGKTMVCVVQDGKKIIYN